MIGWDSLVLNTPKNGIEYRPAGKTSPPQNRDRDSHEDFSSRADSESWRPLCGWLGDYHALLAKESDPVDRDLIFSLERQLWGLKSAECISSDILVSWNVCNLRIELGFPHEQEILAKHM